jgi:hypothetical protein
LEVVKGYFAFEQHFTSKRFFACSAGSPQGPAAAAYIEELAK